MKRSRASALYTKLIFYTFILSISVPLLVLVIYSISVSWQYPKLFPETISMKYLVYTFASNRQTTKALIDSVSISFLVTIFTLLIAIPAAKALGTYEFKGREMVKGLVLLPLVVPGITITMGIHISMIRLGLAGNWAGVILIHTIFTLPYAIRLLTDVFEIIGETYEQQAQMLGAGPLRTFIKVTFPMILPGIVSASVMSFIVSFTQYITTFLIGGGRIISLPMLMVPYMQSGEIQIAAVYGLLFIVSALAALAVMERVLGRYYRNLKLFYI